MTKNFYARTLLAAVLAVALLAGRSVGEDRLADAIPAYSQLEGTYYVTLLSHQASGIYIVDPKVVRIGTRLPVQVALRKNSRFLPALNALVAMLYATCV